MKLPWQDTKDARRVRSPNEEWADSIDDHLLPSCHPAQLDAVLDQSRWITFLIGRGGTKTTTMRVRAIRKLARIRNGRLVYCASSRPMAEELMWEPLKATCEKLGLVTGRDVLFNETKLKCTFLKTGATYRLVGMDNKAERDKLRGQPFDEVQIDEASIHNPEEVGDFVHKVIEPRLGDRLGTILLGGTPGHILRGLFYDATRPGGEIHRPYADRDKPENAGFRGWSSHSWNLADVAALPNAARLYPALVNLWNDALEKRAFNRWSEDHPIWQREYLGRWAADDTETVFRYQPSINEWNPFGDRKLDGIFALRTAVEKLPSAYRDWHFVIGMDMGSKDPFSCNVFAFAPSDSSRTIWHVFGFERKGMHAKPIAELLSGTDSVSRVLSGGNAEPYGGIFEVTGWPDAIAFDAAQETIDELGNVYGIAMAKEERKRNEKFGAIELVNGDLLDGRIKVLKGSHLAIQLGELQWQTDSFGNLQENKAQANHSTDGLVYARRAISTLFESGSVEAAPMAPAVKTSEPMYDVAPRGEFDDVVGAADLNFDAMFSGL